MDDDKSTDTSTGVDAQVSDSADTSASAGDSFLKGLNDDDVDMDTDSSNDESANVAQDDNDPIEQESDESDEETDDSDDKEDTDESDESESDDAEESTQETPQDRARREYQERQTSRQQLDARQAQVRQQQAQEYLQEAEDDRDVAIRQLQVENYERSVQINEQQIRNDYDSAIKEIDMFNPESEHFNEIAYNDAISEYEKYVQTDEVGNVTGVARPLKQYLQGKAQLYGSLLQNGATRGQQAERKMRSKATPVPTRAPKRSQTDPIMDALMSD